MKIILAALLTVSFSSIGYAQNCKKPAVPQFDAKKYYRPAEGKNGEELKTALNGIIKGHIRYGYRCVWNILGEADEDPNNKDNIITFYKRSSVPKSFRTGAPGVGNHPDSWNREHIWAKSHGFQQKNQHAFTDAHHLRASDMTCNSKRGNRDFVNGGRLDDECGFFKFGDGTVEAPDIVKGDTARMMFYMAVRYDGDNESNTPDLELIDRTTETRTPLFGKLCTLLEWHKKDPVSDEERKRNDVIYSWQGNRNPFIDHPEWAESIWGNKCGI